ncbi:MAG: hypothetical protein KIH01_05915, partial [Candidatus Freyarchaeota archaeon]|nr:hypothetical protein [Candidatus Jordarchaeia archaeon]
KGGLKIDRQLNACVNLYLQVEGLSPSPKLFVGLVRGWGGFTLTGGEADAGSDEPVRGFKACEPQGLSMDQYLSILSLEPST